MNTELEIKDKTDTIESIRISTFKKNIRKTTPHKHNRYFEIIYLTEGTGKHTVDTQTFEIKPPIVFLIRKEQVHFWNIETEPVGFVLIIKKSFIDNSLDREIKLLLAKISASTCLFPHDNTAIEQLFSLLSDEYHKGEPINTIVLEGLLKALLAKLLQSDKPNLNVKPNKGNLFQHFTELLSQQNRLINKVAHYAYLLNTTPQNLNAICRKEANQSATEIISEFIVSEAKRLLLYTDLTVSEVSFALDFKDNSHFTKYFKRHTEITPNAFRSTTK